MKYRFASLLLLFCLSLLTACGGGGGGGSTSAAPVEEPAPSSPEPEPTPIAITDAVPGDGTTGADPVQPDFYFAHPAQSDLSITFDSNCSDSRALTQKRSLVDLASADFDELVTHYVSCNLAENTTYSIAANGTRSNDAGYVANLEFSTGTSAAPGITVLDQISLARSTVNDLFRDYVEGGLVTELDLPASIQSLVIDLVIDLSEANWDNLTDPQSLYPVTSQSVTYLSRTPDGSPSTELTGLISFPVVELSPKFVARDRVLVLTHATGSTPGDLATGDAWYILANLFASRGYLVVAPDNYGRGGTSENPET